MTPTPYVRYGFSTSPERLAAWRAAAEAQGMSLSAWIQMALNHALEEFKEAIQAEGV